MRSLAVFFVVVLTGWIYPAAAQSFVVESSSPVQGQVNVPLNTTVRFEFSDELDVNTDWNTAFVVEPRDSVQISRVSLLLDDQQRPAVVEYTVLHTQATDVTWLVYAVQSADAEAMTEPFVLRYTTAASAGPYTVSGTVGAPAAKQGAPEALVKANLARLADAMRRYGRGELGFRRLETPVLPSPEQPEELPDYASKVDFQSLTVRAESDHTQVLLVEEFASNEAGWNVKAATVIEGSSGPFTVEYVRSGTYWPVAVRYTDAGNTEIEALGYYDADGDGEPDPVVVDGASRSGIAVALYSFPLTTARANLAAARAAAEEFADDQRLVMLQGGYGVRPAGTAYEWVYRFFSPSENLATTVTVDPLSVEAETVTAPGYMAAMTAIPDAFLDSDAASETAQANGGSEFLHPYRPSNLVTVLEGGNLYWHFPAGTAEAFWRMHYVAVTTSGTKTFTTFVDMGSGAILTDSEDDPQVPLAARLDQNYPNPFSSQTVIPFRLSRGGAVRLGIYNMLGQVVVRLVDDILPPGEHRAIWNAAGLPSGMYVCRLEADGTTLHRSIILQK